MKSGAGDDPFADASTEQDVEESISDSASTTTQSRDTRQQSQTEPVAERRSERPQPQSLPYKYQRASVKEGRSQRPMFIQATTEELIEEVADRVDDRFNETVYKTDVVEAMLVAGGERSTPEKVLERWGYGMKSQ